VSRTKEVQSNNAFGARRRFRDLINVQIRRVGRQDGPGLDDRVQFREDGPLDFDVLEHRFYNDVRRIETRIIKLRLNPRQPALHLIRGDFPLLHGTPAARLDRPDGRL